jgi:type II secretory pathway component PulF
MLQTVETSLKRRVKLLGLLRKIEVLFALVGLALIIGLIVYIFDIFPQTSSVINQVVTQLPEPLRSFALSVIQNGQIILAAFFGILAMIVVFYMANRVRRVHKIALGGS